MPGGGGGARRERRRRRGCPEGASNLGSNAEERFMYPCKPLLLLRYCCNLRTPVIARLDCRQYTFGPSSVAAFAASPPPEHEQQQEEGRPQRCHTSCSRSIEEAQARCFWHGKRARSQCSRPSLVAVGLKRILQALAGLRHLQTLSAERGSRSHRSHCKNRQRCRRQRRRGARGCRKVLSKLGVCLTFAPSLSFWL
jgi:hypothetical protein